MPNGAQHVDGQAFSAMNTVNISVVSLVVSILSLTLSAVVALYTVFWRGKLKMARPTYVAFAYDPIEDQDAPKVVLRTLLYATGKRGILIENMFLVLSLGERRQAFSVWGVSETKLDRGAGLFIPETGLVAYHQFVATEWGDFKFDPGECQMEVYATVVGRKRPLRVFSTRLDNDDVQAVVPSCMFCFDWDPSANRYVGYRRM